MQWLNSLVSEYEGRPLQKSGMLTKEQLIKFFQDSAQQFNNPEFKQLLSVAMKTRGPGTAEEIINGMQRQILENMGVQGDFGLNCLARVNGVYGNDAAFLRLFYEHVQKEEMVLDEAEMPESAFRSKYEQLNRYREEMEARLEKLNGMSQEQRNVYLSNVYKEMLARGIGGGECCSNPNGCSHRQPGGPQLPAPEMEAPAVAQPEGGAAAIGPGGPSVMSEAEQLAFFASLNGPGKQ
ncbi:hypothetical protein Agub_g10128 [Astrephomene gubernaculifera]|uniref:Uncharacterized protein n=1 Tax=Astrephomene gubernaculifera TaxID=47775 RepID=A0AAD3DX55_9CHLO|nr:hypothetical protein Agub_g10128 [Astrephomene gubernaculifera]